MQSQRNEAHRPHASCGHPKNAPLSAHPSGTLCRQQVVLQPAHELLLSRKIPLQLRRSRRSRLRLACSGGRFGSWQQGLGGGSGAAARGGSSDAMRRRQRLMQASWQHFQSCVRALWAALPSPPPSLTLRGRQLQAQRGYLMLQPPGLGHERSLQPDPAWRRHAAGTGAVCCCRGGRFVFVRPIAADCLQDAQLQWRGKPEEQGQKNNRGCLVARAGCRQGRDWPQDTCIALERGRVQRAHRESLQARAAKPTCLRPLCPPDAPRTTFHLQRQGKHNARAPAAAAPPLPLRLLCPAQRSVLLQQARPGWKSNTARTCCRSSSTCSCVGRLPSSASSAAACASLAARLPRRPSQRPDQVAASAGRRGSRWAREAGGG